MELDGFVDGLHRELVVAAEAGGDDVRALAERLVRALDSATRLMLLDALSVAADEITRELAPGSVHLRLRGREPDFVVALPAQPEPAGTAAPEEPPPASQADATDGATSRINFRPPESLKARIEEAAGREGLSVNAWLVRAATTALEARDRPDPAARSRSGRLTGWVG
ncbi:hypothetical protein ACFQ34_14920 [Pseudonocardia benzenivorans]|jgi:hypothetical protein|uniref:Histidine kinase n=2 Tax=Pseudonocardia TaxID=1847 RepID=F4CLP7_PSEUX|nr:hypothetical protein [Pseudonocardia dioxanivorans]AEA27100.1 hypothetical protein Psed_4962 [Pseudonocardia dioxanivorans CB1190]GJF07863.1 hypothetical protein PSD17_68080 [Pseudonocardia sp. D17]